MISDFAKEKVFWTRKMNNKLVKFIESRPNIWNPKHPKYTSIEARDQTYAEFACRYGNEFTGQAVKDRWTNIRSTFANYLRKLKASRNKVDGEKYKVNWHLWNGCQFLLKVNKRIKAENISSDICIEDESKELPYLSDVKEEDSSNNEENSLKHLPFKTEDTCQNIAENLFTVFKGVQNDAFGLDNTKHGKIGDTVAKKLSQMNSYNAAMVSHKIMEILLLYDENNPNNPNNIKDDKSMEIS